MYTEQIPLIAIPVQSSLYSRCHEIYRNCVIIFKLLIQILILILIISLVIYIVAEILTNTIEGVREDVRFINSGYTCCDTLKNNTSLRVKCYNMYAPYYMRGAKRPNIYDDA